MKHLFRTIANRRNRRRYDRIERSYKAAGLHAFRFQHCKECGAYVLTKMTSPAPKACSEHKP